MSPHRSSRQLFAPAIHDGMECRERFRSDRGRWVSDGLATMGEVHTGLLQNSTAVSAVLADRLLALVPGDQVLRSERPISHALSPALLTGVDGQLSASSGARVRAIGTAVSRAAITGGHVLQGSAFITLTRGTADRRLPWSHYLALPGIVEVVGKADGSRLADGFLAAAPPAGQLNLGAIGGRVMDRVQGSSDLDHRPAFRSARTKLRWAVTPDSTGSDIVTFALESPTTRTVRLTHAGTDVRAQAQLFEDLALHDWLLTTLLALIERSRIGATTRTEVIKRLRPAIDFLLHLWMPAARVDQALAGLWYGLDQRPGLSRQWQVNVDRVRDQMALSAIERLGGG